MTRKELVEKMFDTDILTQFKNLSLDKGCQGFDCEEHGCDECQYLNFWNKEVSLAEVYANLSTLDAGKMLYKGFLNSIYDVSNIKYHNTDSVMNLPIDNWVEVPSALIVDDMHSIGEILDDATVHGLDFKYENGKYYYKERQAVSN